METFYYIVFGFLALNVAGVVYYQGRWVPRFSTPDGNPLPCPRHSDQPTLACPYCPCASYSGSSGPDSGASVASFRKLRNNYVLVFSLMMGAQAVDDRVLPSCLLDTCKRHATSNFLLSSF